MNALRVRVGADQSVGGGLWNGPVDSRSHEFTYVAIPEISAVHAGMEKRTLTTGSLLKDYLDWPHAAQVFKLERQVWDLDMKPIRSQVVYGLTSLSAPQADPARLLELTRGYWGIENGLHYRRDVTLHEDATRIRNVRQAEVTAILNNLLIGIVLQHGWHNLAEAQRYYAANLASALRLFLCHPT